jgi:Kelch motif protein
MIIWGGYFYDGSDHYLNSGGKYSSGTNSWIATATVNAPGPREGHKAVWTGSEMVVWGGYDSSYLNTGGRYDPSSNTWIATSSVNVPTGRASHTAVWTGTEMIVWGGHFFDGDDHYLNSGGRYSPLTNSWIATSMTHGLAPRISHSAVWSDNQMLIWGGLLFVNVGTSTGAIYCTQSGPTPTPTSTPMPTATPTSSGTPTASPTPSGTATVTPTGTPSTTPRVTPTPRSRPTPRPRP